MRAVEDVARRRRSAVLGLLAAALAVAFALGGSALASTQTWPSELTVGYQKYGTLIILKTRGDLERRLAPHGVKVRWAEFSSGPPLLEALNAGRVHFGATGETPPVFGQSAQGSQTTYVAYEPASPRNEALLVRADSPIATVADLRGTRIGVARGSNAHYFVLRALEREGLSVPRDVRIVFLPPSDARSAFARGDIDAWAIWDYFYAVAQADGARVLIDGEGLVDNYGFYLAPSLFLQNHPQVIQIILEEIGRVGAWISANPAAAAEQLARELQVSPAALETAIRRGKFGPQPLTEEVIAAQQRIADTLHAQRLIPRALRVEEAVWHWR